MANSTTGRHRAPGRHNPVSELSILASRAGVTGAKASAVLAASGGLVAAFALPATAAPEADTVTTTALAPAAAAPAAVPAAPAISAPATSAPATVEVVGVTGVTAVAKPKPKPRPVVAAVETRESRVVEARAQASSRSNNRSSNSSSSNSNSNSDSNTSTSSTRTATKKAAAPKPASNNVAQSSSGVVNIARGLLGIAYVYGGSTPAGFDCSGFTQYVFKKAGISIPRTASAQQRAATRVSNPKPGDLVFWGSPAYHVGIYTGPDRMIDSPRTGKSTSERSIWGTPSGYGRF